MGRAGGGGSLPRWGAENGRDPGGEFDFSFLRLIVDEQAARYGQAAEGGQSDVGELHSCNNRGFATDKLLNALFHQMARGTRGATVGLRSSLFPTFDCEFWGQRLSLDFRKLCPARRPGPGQYEKDPYGATPRATNAVKASSCASV